MGAEAGALAQPFPVRGRYEGCDPALLGMGTLKGCCGDGTAEAAGPGVAAVGTELGTSVSWHPLAVPLHLDYPKGRKSRKTTKLGAAGSEQEGSDRSHFPESSRAGDRAGSVTNLHPRNC